MMKEQITQWLDPEVNKNSEYGRISNREWLHAEARRMGNDGQKFFVGRAGKSGLLALFRRINGKGFDNEKRLSK